MILSDLPMQRSILKNPYTIKTFNGEDKVSNGVNFLFSRTLTSGYFSLVPKTSSSEGLFYEMEVCCLIPYM